MVSFIAGLLWAAYVESTVHMEFQTLNHAAPRYSLSAPSLSKVGTMSKYCGCRDCLDSSIDEGLCFECAEAGCDQRGEHICLRLDAYEGSDGMEPDELTYREMRGEA